MSQKNNARNTIRRRTPSDGRSTRRSDIPRDPRSGAPRDPRSRVYRDARLATGPSRSRTIVAIASLVAIYVVIVGLVMVAVFQTASFVPSDANGERAQTITNQQATATEQTSGQDQAEGTDQDEGSGQSQSIWEMFGLTQDQDSDADADANATTTAAKSATVLVYLNGSDLESMAGEASADIAEMLKSGVGENVNVLIETLGTSRWQSFGIESDHTQRYSINQGELELVDDSLGQLDTTDPATLADFISWGTTSYPADRYILLMWDHGAGPVYGFGYDEFQSEQSALTLDEMQDALSANSDVHFDFIGMDCCIMSSLETCMALQPYCDYTVLSEDFEPGIGWSYDGWMATLEDDPSVSTEELGTAIVDEMITETASSRENGEATLALIDESKVDELYDAWVAFAYANKDALLESNYSQEKEWTVRMDDVIEQVLGRAPGAGGHGSGMGSSGMGFDMGGSGMGMDTGYGSGMGGSGLWDMWNLDNSYVTMTDYCITDINQVASTIDGTEATALQSAVDDAIVHFNATSGETGLSGLGVTLPYGDAQFYAQLEQVFKACEIDDEYVDWLEAFVNAKGANSHFDLGGSTDEGNSSGNGIVSNDGSGSSGDSGQTEPNDYGYETHEGPSSNGYSDDGFGNGHGYNDYGSENGYSTNDGYGSESYGGGSDYGFSGEYGFSDHFAA